MKNGKSQNICVGKMKFDLLSANDARRLDEALSVRVTYETSELLVPEPELKL